MNWRNIKTIMIYLLIAMNIFMMSFIFITSTRELSVPDEVISATAEVLKSNGFKCDKSIIPTHNYDLPTLSAEFYSASELSEIFYGKQLAFKTVDNSLVASENGSTLTVTGNYFQYESGYPSDTSFSWRKIKRKLEKLGFDMRNSVYDNNEKCFYHMYKSTNLFNMFMIAELDSDGEISLIRAQWPNNLSPGERKRLSFGKSIPSIKNALESGGKISSIEPGYSLYFSGGGKYDFIPSWRVNVEEKSIIVK